MSASQIVDKASGKHDKDKPIVWIDCEMTGLDQKKDKIIEICCLLTDKHLNLIDQEGYESVIHQPKSVMDNMNEWCIDHHGSSGLTKKVLESNKTTAQVEDELLSYLQSKMSQGVGILGGNSVHVDRLFLLEEMPKVVEYLTYRIIDVSTVMEIAKRHNPEVQRLLPPKVGAHTARQDIIESINQLKFYEEVYLKSAGELDTEGIKAKWDGKDINGTEIAKDHSYKTQ